MSRFIIQFIIMSLLIGVIHFIIFITFEKLEDADVFERSDLMRTHYSAIIEYILTLPAIFVINLGFCGIRFYFEHTKLQEAHFKTQLQVLQQQINPHFMFNVLNHIYILMKKDVDTASNLLVQYSEILRYQLYNGKKEFVTLGDEIQFLQDYINVEKMRWGNELKVSCAWNIENKEKKIQPLILIAFIENAFKHVSRSISETGYVEITLAQEEQSLFLKVENSKSTQKKKEQNSSGIGLRNIKERLEILYSGRYKLSIDEANLVYIIQLNIKL